MVYRCPNCGKNRRSPPDLENTSVYYVPQIAQKTEDNENVSANNTVCIDPLYSCENYKHKLRNSFWPIFAHPRWLSCGKLYSDDYTFDE